MTILLTTIIVFLCGYIVYQKVNSKKRASSLMKKEQETLARFLQLENDNLTKELEAIRKKYENEKDSIKEQHENYRQMIEQESKDIEKAVTSLNKYLDDLKEKQNNTLAAVKEDERIKNEKDFYRLILKKDDIEDIKQLRSIENYLHNKDILQKLIYKTFIEIPMNALFGRIGIKEIPGIYKITNSINNMIYIGQSTNVKKRVKAHIQASLGISTIASQIVHDAMAEDGLENFSFQLLEECDKDKLNSREKYWIDYYDSNHYGYNRTSGGARL